MFVNSWKLFSDKLNKFPFLQLILAFVRWHEFNIFAYFDFIRPLQIKQTISEIGYTYTYHIFIWYTPVTTS